MKILPFGEAAVLVEVDDLDRVLALHARLEASAPAGVVELVPAARTVLVVLDPARMPPSRARAWIAQAAEGDAPAQPAPAEVALPVAYDGDDLREAATILGITADELVRRHSGAAWTVAFTGFAPGFGYLASPDWTFVVPRRPAPRTRVPAGAVGLADGFTGAYPRETPGGWQLIGTTPAALFDPARDPAALLVPGGRVRFRAVRAVASAPPIDPSEPPAPASPESPDSGASPAPADAPSRAAPAATGIRILAPGLRATIQDAGRPGRAAQGIAPSGAADPGSARLANRLVGNAEDAAVIEVTMGGFRARAEGRLEVVVTGAWGAIELAGHPVDPFVVQSWPAGTDLALDWFAHGARAYIAVRGGIAAPAEAGSRSTDTLSGLGPAPLAAGHLLASATDAAAPVPALPLHPWGPPPDGVLEIPIAPGPRGDWFSPDARRALVEAEWTVATSADRVGIRLDGPALERVRGGELPSEGMTPGAVQVPPEGGPVILGVDGPVTGGYPVISVVTAAGRAMLAQAHPGSRLRFTPTSAR